MSLSDATSSDSPNGTGSGLLGLDLLGAFALSFGLAVFATAVDGWPAPRVFDEFSHILSGETFARGRLTNPPSALPQFFETIHVLQRPTYSSKYYPGHGLFLALGIVLGGGARLGQWIAFASMGPAIFWMLRAWQSRLAAILGTSLFVLLLADTRLASGYSGSAIAITGSALLFGAFRRVTDSPRITDAVLLALGVVLVAYTRPFEGLAMSIAPAIFFFGWLLLPSKAQRTRLLRVGIPATLVLLCGFLFLAAHNRAVTGSAWRSSYAEYEARSPGAPPFMWQEPVKATRPLRITEQMRLRIDMSSYQNMRDGWWPEMQRRLVQLTLPHYLPHAVFASLLVLAPLGMRDRRLWIMALSAIAVASATGISSFYLPYYIGPALPPLVLLYAVACGVAWRFRIGARPVGGVVATGVLLALAAMAAQRLVTHNQDETEGADSQHWSRRREALDRNLGALPGTHVVFVRYGASYMSQDEWVQNGPDLVAGKVLWAHDRGEQENERLMATSPQRTPWLLTLESKRVAPPALLPYHSPTVMSGGSRMAPVS